MFIFIGAFLGVCVMAWAAAASNADDHWDAYDKGFNAGVEHIAHQIETRPWN